MSGIYFYLHLTLEEDIYRSLSINSPLRSRQYASLAYFDSLLSIRIVR